MTWDDRTNKLKTYTFTSNFYDNTNTTQNNWEKKSIGPLSTDNECKIFDQVHEFKSPIKNVIQKVKESQDSQKTNLTNNYKLPEG